MTDNNEVKIDIAYILKQIAAIQAQMEYLNTAIEKLAQMDDGDSGDPGSPGNISGKAKAEAFRDIVRCRETTNQQILQFYERVYNDLKTGSFGDPVNDVPRVLKSYNESNMI